MKSKRTARSIMAIEKSLLNIEKMSDLLAREYGLHFKDANPFGVGSANCFKVNCEEGTFLLKEFQSEYLMKDIEKEAALVDFLSKKGFPVASFRQTLKGSFGTEYEGHVISVQDFIEGRSYLNDMPVSYLLECAEYLGKLHTLMQGYELNSFLDEKWLAKFSEEKSASNYDRLLDALEKQSDDPNYEKIRDDLLFRKSLACRVNELKSYFIGITYKPTHGDYTACQLICVDDHIRAVIDFSSASTLPAIWEIMRSYVQSFGHFDLNEFTEYVKQYLRFSDLSRRDLEAMPYVYLFQLSQSLYGYEEYLITKSENRNNLLEYAIWRTNILKSIERQTSEISRTLTSLL